LGCPNSVFAATIVRIMYMLKLDNRDLTYSGLDVWFWSIVEPSLAIFTISLPMIIPLYLRLRGHKPDSPAPAMRDVEGNGQIVTIGGSGGKAKGGRDHDPYQLPATHASVEGDDTASIDEATTIPSSRGSETPLTLGNPYPQLLPPIVITNGRLGDDFIVESR
jgi:hypothetical protein